MTTFTVRASEKITVRLSSAETRSRLDAFTRQPHISLPDPGSGYWRVSITLPAGTVQAFATYSTYSKCPISSALRRIAVERLGAACPSGPEIHRVTDSTIRPFLNASGSHANLQAGNEVAAALISFLVWIIAAGIAVVLASRKKNAA